jgi:hypothetical protein
MLCMGNTGHPSEGFPYGLLAGYLVLPTQRSILSRFHGMPNHATNSHVRNTLENIVKLERGKIVTHYR